MLNRACQFGVLLTALAFACGAVAGSEPAPTNPTAVTEQDTPPGESLDMPSLDAAALTARLNGLESFAASFIQAIAGNRGQVLEQSTGYVLLQRPNFKWVVDDPYPQVIVTAGESLKVYDPDLEQLTIRPLADAITDTPISLLTSSQVDLGEKFQIIRLPLEAEGIDSYVVSPRGDETLFAEIRLTFSPMGLDSLGIVDHLGQYTEIRFQVDPDRVIQSADFELDVPPDTDVIGG
jgi:outer membrane lipoprotein carrier protein